MQAELRFGQPPQILASLAPCSTPHAPLRQTGINTFPVLRAAIQRSLDRAAHPPTARRPSCPIWLAVTLSILLAGLGCRKDPVPSPPEVQPLLYIHPAEADNLARNIERELQARRERSCARPVLRGLSVAGKPDPLIRDLVEASGTLAPCARAATRHQSTLASWLLGPAGASTPLPRLAPQALHAAPPPAVRAALSDLRAHCSSLPGAIARVTRFRSVCNPYRPDGGPRPSLLPLVRLHLAAAAIAVSMAREHPDDALWLLLETLRLDQDLERGPTELAWPLALVAASRPVISVLGAWLCAGLPSRLRPTLARVLDALIATEPWPPGHLRGERLRREWRDYATYHRRARRHQGGVATQARLLAWFGFHRKASRVEQVCAKPTPARTCLGRLRAMEPRPATHTVAELRERWERLQELLARPASASAVRPAARRRIARQALALVESLVELHADANLRSALERSFYLVALRLQMASMGTARAPRITAKAARALARKHKMPWPDEPLRVVTVPDGSLLLAPPLRIAPAGKPRLRYRLRPRGDGAYSSGSTSVP